MALRRRNKVYHTDFMVGGRRYRQSLGTTDWRKAQSLEKDLIAKAQDGLLVNSLDTAARAGFSEAANRYLESRSLELKPNSLKKESHLLSPSSRYFGAKPLNKLTSDDLLSYRLERSRQGVGPSTMNMEMGAIRRVLTRAKLWQFVGADIKPLKEPRSIGRALQPEQLARLLEVSASRPEWANTHAAILLAVNTTMRGCEIKSLRWRDVDLLEKMVDVRNSKTDAGLRRIPLNDEAYGALLGLRERSKLYDGLDPEHHIFPANLHKHTKEGDALFGLTGIDPKLPQKSFRTAWRKITKTAGLPGLRFHDLRHHAITELAELRMSDTAIKAIAAMRMCE
jgi:integrase